MATLQTSHVSDSGETNLLDRGNKNSRGRSGSFPNFSSFLHRSKRTSFTSFSTTNDARHIGWCGYGDLLLEVKFLHTGEPAEQQQLRHLFSKHTHSAFTTVAELRAPKSHHEMFQPEWRAPNTEGRERARRLDAREREVTQWNSNVFVTHLLTTETHRETHVQTYP